MFNELLTRRRVVYVTASFFLLFSLCAPGAVAAGSQAVATGSVSGLVSDSAGAPIPSASVVLINQATGKEYFSLTNASGQYKLYNVPLGAASIKITAKGFAVFQNAVDVTSTQIVTQNAVLSIAHSDIIQVMAVAGPTDGAQGAPDDLVIVSENAVAGPMGYIATPSLTSAVQSQSAQQQALAASQGYNYPSIIFYISAAPLVNLPSTSDQNSKIHADQETDRNPLWLDASFTLSFFDKNGPLPNACTDGSVQVLGLLPQQTVAALKNRTMADVATGVNDVAGALASFYPGVQNQVTAATKAMNVIFQDIFPPQPVAYEYSNLNGNCDFGWYFRPNTGSSAGTSGPASILGIQTGIVLLKTSKNITTINVNGRSISAWNKPPTTSSTKENLFVVSDKQIGSITLPDVSKIDYDNLTTLAMFPSLISRQDAMNILHISAKDDFVAFAAANKLVGTNAAYDYVTNKSLAAFLDLSVPAAKSDEAKPGANSPAPADGAENGTKPPPATKPKAGAATAPKPTTKPAKPKPASPAAH